MYVHDSIAERLAFLLPNRKFPGSNPGGGSCEVQHMANNQALVVQVHFAHEGRVSMQPSPPHSFFPNFTSLQLPCNSSRNLGQAHNHLPSMVQENQLNSSLHNTNSPSSSFIATTRWQRKMDTCGKNTTVTTEENANGKTYSSANISIQCKIPARVSLNTRKDETVTFQSIRDEDHY